MVQGHFKGCLGARTPIPAEQLCPTLSTPLLFQSYCIPVYLKSSFQLPGMLASRSTGMMPGELQSYLSYGQAKVAMETLHPFPDLQPIVPPLMLCPSLPFHTGAGLTRKPR